MVSSAFITHNNKLLMVLRDNKPQIKDPNCWSIIGGNAEQGETPDQTLLREIEEEISVRPTNYQFMQIFDDCWGSHTSVYHVRLTDQEAQQIRLGDEGQKLEFFTADQIVQLPLASAFKPFLTDRQFLDKLLNSLDV